MELFLILAGIFALGWILDKLGFVSSDHQNDTDFPDGFHLDLFSDDD